jgi:hypothetical protein
MGDGAALSQNRMAAVKCRQDMTKGGFLHAASGHMPGAIDRDAASTDIPVAA